MSINSEATVVHAVRLLHDLCDEVVAVSKVLEEHFRSSLPTDYVVDEVTTWPVQHPGNRFFDAFGLWLDVKKKVRKEYFGCASYLFDLKGTLKDQPVAVASWCGADEDYYDIDHFETMLSTHEVMRGRLLRWRGEKGDNTPSDNPKSHAWWYAVPLLSIKNEDDAKRLLIDPLMRLAIVGRLAEHTIDEAFMNAKEVMIN